MFSDEEGVRAAARGDRRGRWPKGRVINEARSCRWHGHAPVKDLPRGMPGATRHAATVMDVPWRAKEGVCNGGSSMWAEWPIHGEPVTRARALPARANAPSIHYRSRVLAILHIARGAAKWRASVS
eukprot:4502339-Pyramimonas_sp.AAC.1